MLCEFETTNTDAGYRQRCKWCGHETTTRLPRFYRRCVTQSVSIVDAGINVSRAFARWSAAGFPTRTDEQRAACFAVCQGCRLFRPGSVAGTGSCGKCGCKLSADSTLMNKIGWATEDCPLSLWPRLAVVALPIVGSSTVATIPQAAVIAAHEAGSAGDRVGKQEGNHDG